jgi:polyphosphate kinase
MIRREAEHAAAGRPNGISWKLNSLVDEELVDELYGASMAGVPIDLVVRGMCVLRPGVPGLSETVRVRSVLGRFLEHSRVFHFVHGGDDEYWIGSADVMHRNLDRRVEALVRVDDQEGKRMLANIFERSTSDDTASWHLQPDGNFVHMSGLDMQADLVQQHRPPLLPSLGHDGALF